MGFMLPKALLMKPVPLQVMQNPWQSVYVGMYRVSEHSTAANSLITAVTLVYPKLSKMLVFQVSPIHPS